MKRSAGFTLIELIIVIVILGILAVTAAPKFMNMQGDARAATVNAMKGSVQSAANIVLSKSVIKGVDKLTTNQNVVYDAAGNYVQTYYGYPTATDAGIKSVLDLDTASWSTSGGNATDQTAYYIYPAGTTSTTCGVVYKNATATAAPTITVTTSGC
jgi:MSHA pilin protein MshA